MLELGVIGVIVAVTIVICNSLVRLRETGDAAWADIDVQLKRRYDLIPNAVETVKGYASHERETLEAVVAARSNAMSAQGPGAKAEAEGALSGALKSLFALAEALSRSQAAGWLPRAPGHAERARAAAGASARVLQRGRSQLQHQGSDLPERAHRSIVGLQRARVLRGNRGGKGIAESKLQR
jgi:hypothetical protein